MICARCLWRATATRSSFLNPRSFSYSSRVLEPPTTALSNRAAQNLSSSLPPKSSPAFAGTASKPAPTESITSSVPAGTPLKGINYLKNHNDPVALPEDEYPAWLWRCLDVKKKDDSEEALDADLFAKSKKLRRKAAKRQRKAEAARLASGDLSLLDPKVPLTQQSIDLPSNSDGTFEGALEADEKRMELKAAMRNERRAKIKEKNYLKSV